MAPTVSLRVPVLTPEGSPWTCDAGELAQPARMTTTGTSSSSSMALGSISPWNFRSSDFKRSVLLVSLTLISTARHIPAPTLRLRIMQNTEPARTAIPSDHQHHLGKSVAYAQPATTREEPE